jgi:hypothetical protein
VERERLVPLAVALLAVLALAVGAATLDDASSGRSVGTGDGPGVAEEGSEMDFGAPPPAEDAETSIVPPWLVRLLIALYFVAGVAALVAWVWRDGLDAVKTVAAFVFVATGVAVLLYALDLNPNLSVGQGRGGILGDVRPSLPSGGGGGGASDVAQVTTDPSAVLVAVVAIVLVGAVAVVLRSASADEDDLSTDPDPEDPDPSVRAVGDAAGRAADRIDASGDVDNAVYRAWREMTDPLDLPRETSTPGEFAAAAVDAGMRREDVSELTRLFETTRYGGVAVDADREERATTALRRIERAYGGDR